MEYSNDFLNALDFTLKEEIGPCYDPSDKEMQQGLCETREQKRKTGYVNHPSDPGGETKFGIAKNSHPNLNIKTLTFEKAKEIYYQEFWIRGKCDKMPSKIAAMHFDACVNHGSGRAAKFLQKALGVAVDGVIGPNTLAVINEVDVNILAQKLIEIRRDFFNSIVENKPDKEVFLDGWLARADRVEKEFIA